MGIKDIIAIFDFAKSEGIEFNATHFFILILTFLIFVVTVPAIITIFGNKKIIKADIMESVRKMFQPLEQKLEAFITDSVKFQSEQKESNAINKNQFSMILTELKASILSIRDINSSSELEVKLAKNINKGIEFIENNEKLKIDVSRYLQRVKEILIESYIHYQVNSFNDLANIENEVEIQAKIIREHFIDVFGVEKISEYVQKDNHLKQFISSLKEISELNANSKRERFTNAIISVMDSAIANVVSFSLKELITLDRYKCKK